MKNQNFDLDRGIFSLAFTVVRYNWVPCGGAALLLLVTNLGQGYLYAPLAFVVLRALIIMIVGYSAYRVLLTDGGVAGWRTLGTDGGRIPWRYAGVMLMILAPILILGIVWSAPGTGAGPSNPGQIVFGVTMTVGYAAIYVLLGTALPEVAERGEVVLGDAFQRGRTNYRAIAKSMILGAWLFRAGSVAALIIASLMGVPVDLFGGPTGGLQHAALLPMLMFTSCHVFAEVLTAVVLVRAYRRFPVSPSHAIPA
ncbi:MAG TPA: hypothetical protein VMY41_03315 [Thermohalobaculum sp.]|nr:hypothetical protein [Thermohalobaculum sp.]